MCPILNAVVVSLALAGAADAAEKDRCRLSDVVGLKYYWLYEGDCVKSRGEGRGVRNKCSRGPDALLLYQCEKKRLLGRRKPVDGAGVLRRSGGAFGPHSPRQAAQPVPAGPSQARETRGAD